MAMPTLGLSMIVKNEADTLGRCLQSVRGIVSQIVIADTGSTDNTVAIARECGACVVSFSWENHYANARNAALAPMTTDWILSLDADEELDADAIQAIPGLLRASSVAGYNLSIRNYTLATQVRAGNSIGQPNDCRHVRAQAAPSYFLYEKCRLFRRDSETYFTGRVHEQVELTMRARGLQIRPSKLLIHNFGLLLDRGDMSQKIASYRDLLRLRVSEDAGDFRGWTYLGRMEYDSFNNRTEALRCFHKALELNPKCVEALIFTAMIHLDLGQSEEALEYLDFGAPDDGSALLQQQLLGDAFSQIGQLQKAEAAYRHALDRRCDDPELESKLGFIEVKLGMSETGIARLLHAAAAQPDRADIQDRLMKAFLVRNMLPEAADAAECLSGLVAHPRTFLRAASIHAQLKQWADSKRLLERGLQLFPHARELESAYAEAVSESNRG